MSPFDEKGEKYLCIPSDVEVWIGTGIELFVIAQELNISFFKKLPHIDPFIIFVSWAN